MNDNALLESARSAARNSYSPYSHFRVGAAVIDVDGNVFTGANVENASYPVSSCAEATTINYAVAQGARQIEAVAVACIDAEDIEKAYPCGRCRQIMGEFGVRRVLVTGSGTDYREHTFSELLPHHFRLEGH